MEGSKVEPQYKPVNHWQYSMTSLATPFPLSLTSPSFPPFFSPLPLTPSLSLAFSYSLFFTSVPATFISSAIHPHSFTFFSPSPLSPKLSATFPQWSEQQTSFIYTSTRSDLRTNLFTTLLQLVYKADYSQQMSLNC